MLKADIFCSLFFLLFPILIETKYRGRTTISNESILSFENGDFETGILTINLFRKIAKDSRFEINFENGYFDTLFCP